MLKIENVQGSRVAAQPLILDVDTVYVHTGVTKVEPTEDENGIVNDDLYTYTEYQYTYPEFKALYSEVSSRLEEDTIDKYTLLLVEKGVL